MLKAGGSKKLGSKVVDMDECASSLISDFVVELDDYMEPISEPFSEELKI